MPPEDRRICVFCGSQKGRRPAYADAARSLGEEMVRRGYGLVFGGGAVGLMGIIADTVLEAGGRVTGVIPHGLMAREVGHTGVEDLRPVATMHERKAIMAGLSEAFVVLPGGLGTLEETFEAITWHQLGIHLKPCGLLDVEGYWQPLLRVIDRAVEEGFVRPENRDLLLVHERPGDLLDALEAHESPITARWLHPEEL